MGKFWGRWRIRTDEDGLISTPFKVYLTLFICLILALVASFATDFLYRDSLKLRAQTIAAALSNDEVTAALPNNKTHREYLTLKVKLSRLKAINEDVRDISIITNTPNGVFMVADSESPDSPYYAKQGALYTSPAFSLSELFDNPHTTIETVELNNSNNRRLSAISPITNNQTGAAESLAIMDVPVDNYYSLLVISALVPITLGLALSLIIVFLDKARAHRLEILRFRSELVSIASHELRTPLTGIRWSEENMLNDKKLPQTTHTTVSEMYQSTLKLQESIEDILQLAGLQNAQIKHLKKVPTDITMMINGIFATQQLPASQHGIKLEFAHSWPKEVMVNCDPVRMRRVFNNIISNAIKYTRPNTSVIVGYENVDGAHLFTVKDQGIGIPQKDQKKVFNGFYRADNAVKYEANGTGMGLYLSRSVLEQHGGSMWLRSVVNKGTTVFMRLP